MSESLEEMWKRRERRTSEGDDWDAKAERIHGVPRPEGTPVRIVDVSLPFSAVFVLAFQVFISWAILCGIVVVALVLLDVV